MEPRPKPFLTPEDYLAIERQAETRSDYLDGEMFAMTGGSLKHSLIVGNLVRELSSQLKKRHCQVFPSDLRVHTPATGLYTYSDVIVVCGEPRLQDEYHDTLLNPTVISEVLSPTTEAYDRGKKFQHYQTIQSLAEYLLVSQSEPRVEQFFRQDDNRWLLTTTTGLDATLALPSIQCELALAEAYEKIAF